MTHSILRLPGVRKTVGLSRSQIYLLMSAGKFPASISLGDRAVGWVEAEIQEWLVDRIQGSRPDNSIATKRLKEGNDEA